MSERALGCHCDLEPGQQPTGCVLDGHEPVENCSVAMRLRAEGKSQAQCEHWRPVQPSEVEQLRAEVERLRITDDEVAAMLASARAAASAGWVRRERVLLALLSRLSGTGNTLALTDECVERMRAAPTLADAEREAIESAIDIADAVGNPYLGNALRALLARHGGGA